MNPATRHLVTPIWPRDRACPPRDPAAPFAPMADAILLGPEAHRCIVAHPRGGSAIVPIGRGVTLAWSPTPELGGVTLAQFFVQGSDRGLATVLSRTGLRAMIADLQSIEAQMSEDPSNPSTQSGAPAVPAPSAPTPPSPYQPENANER